MAGDFMKPAATGDRQRFTRNWFNTVTQSAQSFKRGRDTLSASSLRVRTPEGMVWVGNNSGADVDRFQVLGIDNIFFGPDDNLDEFLNRDAFIGVTPTKAAHTGLFVVTSEPIKNNGIGRAWAFGVATVRVHMLQEGDDTADVADGDKKELESGPIGSAQLLWVGEDERDHDDPEWADLPDVRWAKARIGNGQLPAFPVTLSNPAGSFGSNKPLTQASLTYTVHHAKNGRKIGDNIPVWMSRQYGHVTAATKGYCDRIDNATVIVIHDEVIDASNCT